MDRDPTVKIKQRRGCSPSRFLACFSGKVCVLEADGDGVSEVLGGEGKADGDQIDEAMKME
jgi:hypothetical protein